MDGSRSCAPTPKFSTPPTTNTPSSPRVREIHLLTLVSRALAQVQECELALPLLSQVTGIQDDYRDAWIVQGFCELSSERGPRSTRVVGARVSIGSGEARDAVFPCTCLQHARRSSQRHHLPAVRIAKWIRARLRSAPPARERSTRNQQHRSCTRSVLADDAAPR